MALKMYNIVLFLVRMFVLAVSKSLSLLRTVPRVPGNISILGDKIV